MDKIINKGLEELSIEKVGAIYDLIPVAISISSIADGKNIYANKALEKLFQLDKKNIIGKTSVELNIVDVQSRAQIAEQVKANAKVDGIELQLRTSTGEVKTILTSVETIQLSNQKFFLSTLVDITKQKEAELELKESNDRLKSVLDISPVAIVIANAETRQFVLVNSAAEKLFEFTSAELIGKSGVELNIATTQQSNKNKEDFENAGGSIRNMENVARTKNGKIKDLIISIEKIEWNNQTCLLSIITDITELKNSKIEILEQKRMSAELAEAKKTADLAVDKMDVQAKLVEGLLMNAPAFICTLVGPNHVYDLVNDRYHQIFGKRQLKGLPVMVALPELEGQGFDTILDNVYNYGEVFIGEDIPTVCARDINLEPALCYFNFSYQPMYDENKSIYGILVFGYETTGNVNDKKKNLESQQKNALELEQKVQQRTIELIEANEMLQKKNFQIEIVSSALNIRNAQLLEAQHLGQIGNWDWTMADNNISLSDEYCKMFGLKENKVKVHYKTFMSWIHPEDVHNVGNIMKQALIDHQPYNFFHRVIHPDNSERTIYISGKVLTDSSGKVERMSGIGQDVTDKIMASQHAYSRSLIEAGLDPLIVIGVTGKITDMNVAFLNATGKTRETLLETDFFIYFTEPEKARKVYEQVFERGFVTDYPLILIDDHLTNVLFNGSVYKDEKGIVLGAVVVARDITEQNRIATELTEAKRFAEEAKFKAESARLIAEAAAESKQQFLSNMSHEIRTPMNAIIGFTKVILKTELTAKQKEYLTAIKVSGDALIVLINDILDLAKVDAGKMTFEQKPFKLDVSISSMLHLFETKIQEKNLEIIKKYDNKIPKVLLGDSARLNQIVLNLVSNAVKFTNQGIITFSVNLINETDEQVTIEFSVNDTGIGIDKNKLENIFENFHQASPGISRIYGGTGLGLSIVKQLVEAQGGSLEVNSEINAGSTFSFKLKFPKTKETVESLPDIFELDNENKDIKVLVVEDMALNQLLMKTLLDDFGFGRDIADNGKIAIEKLDAKSYDIILMDLQMPEMNGFEATDYIRNVLHSKIPIIALTADVTTVDLAKCKAVGMNDYIAKPIDERLLYSKIVNLVKKSVVVETGHALSKNSENETGHALSKNTENETGHALSLPTQKIKYIDLTYLLQRTKSNPKLMSEMITLYIEQTPPLITAMKKSFLEQDWVLLKASVHKMIPSFAIMGMSTEFENMAKKIQEYATKQFQTESIHEIVTQLENICLQACLELEKELAIYRNELK